MKLNQVPVLLLVLAGLTQPAWAGEPNPDNGRRLFEASRCLHCHGTDVFTRVDRKVNSLTELDQQVRICDASLSTNWFDDQVLDVVAWLNQVYYKFPPAKQKQ